MASAGGHGSAARLICGGWRGHQPLVSYAQPGTGQAAMALCPIDRCSVEAYGGTETAHYGQPAAAGRQWSEKPGNDDNFERRVHLSVRPFAPPRARAVPNWEILSPCWTAAGFRASVHLHPAQHEFYAEHGPNSRAGAAFLRTSRPQPRATGQATARSMARFQRQRTTTEAKASTPICLFPTGPNAACHRFCADLPLGWAEPILGRLSLCTHCLGVIGASGTR